jgi:hypothetical protein
LTFRFRTSLYYYFAEKDMLHEHPPQLSHRPSGEKKP